MTGKTRVELRVHLAAAPETVYGFLATDAGRAAFWAESALETGGMIDFRFSNGMTLQSRILAAQPPDLFTVSYFGGSRAEFSLRPATGGGTDLTLTETGIDAAWYVDQRAGWVSVLLTLKAAVDFSIDLRNPFPEKDWARGFVDV